MEFRVIFKTSRKATIGLLRGGVYFADEPYRVYVNGKLHSESKLVVHTIEGLKPDTTIIAIQTALKHLNKEGIIAVSIYHGGDSGYEERDSVLSYLETLDKHNYNVIIHHYSNKPNDPPILAVICHNH